MVSREFRAAWVASVYNIDWPSRKGLSAASQKAELRRLLDQAQQMKLNAIIFQVRPHADALYRSKYEPWSHWLTGTMGKNPGYDPLKYCIQEAHARGVEVHAWFNPFRALPNASMATSSDHITKRKPGVIRPFRNMKWMDISDPFASRRATAVIMDVVSRYDVDGIHLDDYFYPYPQVDQAGRAKQNFPDQKNYNRYRRQGGRADLHAWRRGHVDRFVSNLYTSIKSKKPHVRFGISPFGIWQPGYPRGIEASINAYHHLAADSRKWLSKGWVDYLSPQLYWRNQPRKQSYSALLSWWRKQGRRPVWPGIATDRINSKVDPGRPASEIWKQVDLSRTIDRNWVGHIHWSMKSLMQNRGGVKTGLMKNAYAEPALVPPMPWLSQSKPPTVRQVNAARSSQGTQISWSPPRRDLRFAVQTLQRGAWRTVSVLPARTSRVMVSGSPEAIAVSSVDRFGSVSSPFVIRKK